MKVIIQCSDDERGDAEDVWGWIRNGESDADIDIEIEVQS
jgi:hypothetical protein